MKKLLITSVAISLALVGCAGTSGKTQQAATPTKIVTAEGQTRFQCDNGLTVFVKQLNTEQIQLNVQNYQATMDLAPAGSGERYLTTKGLFGTGGEWHQKGNEAFFGYKGVHGAVGATTCTSELNKS